MSNADQEEFWSTQAGHTWVTLQGEMDALLQPVLDLVLDAAALPAGARVLDVGSGTGASVEAATGQVGTRGHVTGVDISEPMLALARARLADRPNCTCLKADAQTYPFDPAQYDAMISRFGVMFFDDTTAAFANIATSLTPGASLTFAAWGPAPQNPYFMDAAAAARAVFGPTDKVDRTLPGPFAFEECARIMPMLSQAGLVDVACVAHHLHLVAPANMDALTELLCQIGPAQSALNRFDASADQRDSLKDALAHRFARYQTASGIEIPALINLYTARTAS